MPHAPDFAVTSQRVVTPEGERAAAVLIKGEKILDVVGYQISLRAATPRIWETMW